MRVIYFLLFLGLLPSAKVQSESAFLKVMGRLPGIEKPVAVRAIIEQSHGAIVPGEWGDSTWPPVTFRGKAMDPFNLIEVPLGETKITVGKGPDYLPQTLVTNLSEKGRVYQIEFNLEPVLDLYGKGWRAGDAHIHFFHGDNQVARSPEEAFRICAAGGLNFASFAGEHFGAGLLTRTQALQVWKPYQDSECQLWLGAEAPKSTWGHHAAIAYDPWTVQDHLPYSVGIHAVHLQGGVSFPVHPDRTFPSRESEGEFSLYPLNNHLKFLPVSALSGHLLDGWSAISDQPSGPGTLDTYHKLLDMGYKIPLLADSDYCMDRINNGLKAPGFWMNYLYLGEQPLSKAAVCEAIRRGRVMATTGPLVLFTIDDAMPGDSLPADGSKRVIRIEASYRFNPWTLSSSNFLGTEACAISSVQLLRNGEVVREWTPNTPSVLLEETLPAERDNCNYMVQVLGNEGVWMAAYASPIYFERTPQPRKPGVFKPFVQGRLYDAQSGLALTGTVSCVRFGKTEWTMPTDENGLFRAWVPINANLVARDAEGRELSRNWLTHEPAYRFCSYLPDEYSGRKAEAIDDFMEMMQGMIWEFPIGLQSASSYVRTNLEADAQFTGVEILEAPDQKVGKNHTEIVALLVDKTQAEAGDAIHYAVLFRSGSGGPPTETLQVQWGGWDPKYPRLYTRYGKQFAETRPWEELIDLGGGFYMRTNTVVIPDWVRNLGESGGILCRATVRRSEVIEDAGLIIPVGPAKRELLVSTTWDGFPATWGARGVGPCNFNREIAWRVRYPDYRGITIKMNLNGESILINPLQDTSHVADADDAIFEDHFYYDGQCEPEFRNIPFRDPVREQPPHPDFSRTDLYLFADRTAPDVILMEPFETEKVTSPVRLYYHLEEAGLSGAAGAEILVNGEVVVTNTREVPIVLQLEPGDYTWQVRGRDRTGNTGVSETRRFTVVEEHPPTPPVVIEDVAVMNGVFSLGFPAMPGANYLMEQATSGKDWRGLIRTNASSEYLRFSVPVPENGTGAFRVRSDP